MSYLLDTKIPSFTIFLDSTKAITRDPFVFNLNTPITCPTSLRMLISLQELTISNTFNNITTSNNKISFNLWNYSSNTIEIPIGIYNVYTFRDYLNSTTLFNNWNITCVYDKYSYKYSFVSTLDIRVINNETYPTTCGGIIGLGKNNNNEYIEMTYPSGGPTYTILMPSSVDFSGTPFIYLKVQNLPLININSYGAINDTFSRIPVNSPLGYKIFYRPTESIKYLIGRQVFNGITLSIEDTNNINIVGSSEFQLLLKIDYIYPPKDKEDILSGSLLYDMRKLTLPDETQENEVDDI
jgi:hypothetical protein